MSLSLVKQWHQIMWQDMCSTEMMFRYLLEPVRITHYQTTIGQMMEIILAKSQPLKHPGHQRLIQLLSCSCVSYISTGNPTMSFIFVGSWGKSLCFSLHNKSQNTSKKAYLPFSMIWWLMAIFLWTRLYA